VLATGRDIGPAEDFVAICADEERFRAWYVFGPDGLLHAIAGGDHCGGPPPTGADAASILVFEVTLPGQTPGQSPS
jgi:hypothetical protein